MDLTTVFLGLFALAFFGLLWWHFKRRGAANGFHANRIEQLEYAFRTHRQQIKIREGALSQYHFLKYNLSAALLEQPEIQL